MYKHYYFNNSVDNHGVHEIHAKDCNYMPHPLKRTYIGYFADCKQALSKAKSDHPSMRFDGCFWCCRDCHKL